jgi:hypothetical protein
MTDVWIKENLNAIIKQFEDEKFWSTVSNSHDKKKSNILVSSSNAFKLSSSRRHINELSLESISWRVMQKYSFVAEFQKTAQIKFDVIDNRETWQVVDRSKTERVKITSLKWVFKCKTNENEYLLKFKARIVVRHDLQMINNAQDVYAVILTSKTFRMLMTLIVAYELKTRQLDAINAFLNAKNYEIIYCYISDKYRLSGKIYKMIRVLYDQRKSLLLWLRLLTVKCLELELKLISNESCLFIDENDIIMFFFVNDLIFAYRPDRENAIE